MLYFLFRGFYLLGVSERWLFLLIKAQLEW